MKKVIVSIAQIPQSIHFVRGQKFAKLEAKVGKHDDEITAIIDAIRHLMTPPKKPAREIGFHVRETSPRYGTRRHG